MSEKNEVNETEEHKFEDVPDEEEKIEISGPESKETQEEVPNEPESSSGEEEEESEEESEEKSKDEPEEEPSVPSKPKPVEGETEREKALRLEVQRLKGDRRRAKLNIQEESKPEVDRMKELEEDYTPEELIKMTKAIDILAEKGGYVKQSKVQQDAANDVLDDFLIKNKEYAPTNDVEDIRWNAFQRILADDYNIKNKSPHQIKTIFNKVHRDVNDEFGISEDATPVRNEKAIEAQKQKIRSVSHTGGTKAKSIKSEGEHLKKMDSGTRKMFKGDWSENDF